MYKVNDPVLIEYWYNDMITPVIIIEIINKVKVKVSHNHQKSSIRNAPDEIVYVSDIIDKFKN